MSDDARRRAIDATVPAYLLDATRALLAIREAELLGLCGPCSNRGCRLHRAHSGPCDLLGPVEPNTEGSAHG